MQLFAELAARRGGARALNGGCLGEQVQDANNPPEATEEREEVGFEGPVDSVYLGAKDYVELDVGTGAAVAIASSGWEDVVVVRFAALRTSPPSSAPLKDTASET